MTNWNEKERDRLLNSSIQNARDSNLKLNVKIIGTKCCTECDEINGTIVSMEEYLNNPILPFHKCTRNSLPNPPYSATFLYMHTWVCAVKRQQWKTYKFKTTKK